MMIKEYTITVRVKARRFEDFPSIDGLVNGINDGLPDDWFSTSEGNDYAIVSFLYSEANNPKYLRSGRVNQ